MGAEFLRIVETRYPNLPKLKLLASSRSAGKHISVGGKDLVVEEATEKSFDGVDVAFISASSEVSHQLAPAAVAAGAVVIDDGSAFRMEDTVPLVVPEVNGADVEDRKSTRLNSSHALISYAVFCLKKKKKQKETKTKTNTTLHTPY